MYNRFARLLGLVCIILSPCATADSGDNNDPHAAHRNMQNQSQARVVTTDYVVPDIALTDSSGKKTNLRELMSDDQSLVVNFIFTTCTTICPVITATTLQLQKELRSEDEQPNYVSISIDPDYDSESILREYAANFGADWTFLTGENADIMTALTAFDAYRGSKVNHFALILMRPANSSEWTRVEGLTSVQTLADVWRNASL